MKMPAIRICEHGHNLEGELRNIDASEKSNSIPNSDGGRAGGVHSHAKSRG
jgi:hypothetical protein